MQYGDEHKEPVARAHIMNRGDDSVHRKLIPLPRTRNRFLEAEGSTF
jgi:hypothetical protein